MWRNCSLAELLRENNAGVPDEEKLKNSDKVLPYVFVGDDAFPLTTYLMKPFPFRNQSVEVRIFSYRLSRARRIVENAFGILSSRFRIFLSTLNLAPDKVETVTLASIVLHNYLRRQHAATTCSTVDTEDVDHGLVRGGTWRRQQMIPLERIPRRPTEQAKNIRNLFKDYFNGEGSVPWQGNMI